MHIVSSVTGTLRPESGAMDALRACLPAGTLSGAPKIRAMEIIDELEPVKRGFYGGAIGYLSYTGDLDTCIHIRTVVVKDGVAYVQAGAGVVADSDPAYEYRETRREGGGDVRGARAGVSAGGLGMKVLVIDNYDSFTYNLVQYLGELGAEPDVVRNDAATVDELLAARPDRVVISPGPCRPVDAGVSIEAARRFPEEGMPVLGVCLGHQAMAEAFGGRSSVGEPVHGKTAEVTPRRPLDLPRRREPARRRGATTRSWSDPDLPDELELSAESGDTVMGDPAPHAARRGRAVPPRVGADRQRQAHPRATSCARMTPARERADAERRPDRRDRRGRLRPRPDAPSRRRTCWPRSWRARSARRRRPPS